MTRMYMRTHYKIKVGGDLQAGSRLLKLCSITYLYIKQLTEKI